MLLTVHNLEVCYGVISALQDVSLEIAQGEIVTLIGANGAGKTTLLRTISSLIQQQRGTVIFDGHDVSTLRPHEIVRLGMSHVPEGRQIFPHHTVRENLLLGAYQDKDKQRVRTNLDRCYELFPVLAERREQKAGTLSGGEQQMLAIGRAMMSRPRLLMLDEPSMGLSPIMMQRIFTVIGELQSQGTTILLVEQNAQAALSLADHGYVIETGLIVLDGPGSDLMHDEGVRKAYLGED
jgi:branched-chain amino acid transport system ATP-binding protein